MAPALEILNSTDLARELLEAVYPLEELPHQLDRIAKGEIQGKVLFDPQMTRS
jgi:(R,R)-butanediol dehydrogenase/meso-butanediol dehydrogenase/diacetyl reductase